MRSFASRLAILFVLNCKCKLNLTNEFDYSLCFLIFNMLLLSSQCENADLAMSPVTSRRDYVWQENCKSAVIVEPPNVNCSFRLFLRKEIHAIFNLSRYPLTAEFILGRNVCRKLAKISCCNIFTIELSLTLLSIGLIINSIHVAQISLISVIMLSTSEDCFFRIIQSRSHPYNAESHSIDHCITGMFC
jgi:hypothetical protein